jgi:hypothetical protein
MNVEVSRLIWRRGLFVRAYLLALLIRRRRCGEIDRVWRLFLDLFLGGCSPTLIPNSKSNDNIKRQSRSSASPPQRQKPVAGDPGFAKDDNQKNNGNSYSNCKNEMRGLSTRAASAPPPVEMTAFCQSRKAASHVTHDDDNLRAANGMSQRQRYCGCGGSDRNISTGSA